MKKQAFTLAETLITLTIIGVIAAITVPTLIQNTQKQEYVSALKKAYSTLSQVTQQIITEEGSPKCSEGGWGCTADDIYKQYKKHLNIAKDCGSETGCFIYKNFTQLSGKVETGIDRDESGDRRNIVLSDGMLVNFSSSVNTNAQLQNCSYDGEGLRNVCAFMHIDINGVKGPNKIGRDVFLFAVKENGVYPAGCEYDSCIGTNGWGCACKVLREGAMNY